MLSTKGKIVSKYGNISKLRLRGGVPSTPPPPLPQLYHGGGMNLRVRPSPRVKQFKFTIALITR